MEQENNSHPVLKYLLEFGFSLIETKTIPFEDFKYNFTDGQTPENMQKFPPNQDYWFIKFSKLRNMQDEIDDDYLESETMERLERIIDHYERLASHTLTKKERKRRPPSNFFGPYLPIPSELYALQNLNIAIDWNLSEVQKAEKPASDCPELKTGYFSMKENKKLVKRWEKFKQQYNFHDIRPLVGARTTVIIKNITGELSFYRITYLKKKQMASFNTFMGKRLPRRTISQIRNKVHLKIDMFADIDSARRYTSVSYLDFSLITWFLENFGFSEYALDVVIGNRSTNKFKDICKKNHRMMHIPLKWGPWKLEEDSNFIKTIAAVTKPKEVRELCTKKLKIHWLKIFDIMKCRYVNSFYNHWKDLKQKLHMALNAESGKSTRWTNENLIKLINLVYEQGAEDSSEIHWDMIAKEFPQCIDYEVRNMFQSLYKTRVPGGIRRYTFEEAVEYLHDNSHKGFVSRDIRLYSGGLKDNVQHYKKILDQIDEELKLNCEQEDIGLAELFNNEPAQAEENEALARVCEQPVPSIRKRKKNERVHVEQIVTNSSTESNRNGKHKSQRTPQLLADVPIQENNVCEENVSRKRKREQNADCRDGENEVVRNKKKRNRREREVYLLTEPLEGHVSTEPKQSIKNRRHKDSENMKYLSVEPVSEYIHNLNPVANKKKKHKSKRHKCQ